MTAGRTSLGRRAPPIGAGSTRPHAISDADWEVYVRAKAAYERPTEVAPEERVEHHSAAASEQQAVAAVIDALVGQLEAG